MIQKLRRKMLLICSSITALILMFTCLIAFYIFNRHYQAEEQATLEAQLSTLIRSLQQESSISHQYLKELEYKFHLLIFIEDNGSPLQYQPGLETPEVSQLLFAKAQELAIKDYDFRLNPLYISSLEFPTALFKFKGDNGKDYLATLCLFSTNHGHCKVILLKDLTSSNLYILYIQLLFIGLVIFGTLLLVVFSFFFVGMAIKPIEASSKKQTEFIAAASHELRAPLTIIETGMSSLTYEPDSPSAHFISVMKSECKRMQKLISDLLLLARSDAGQWQMQFQECEMEGMLIELYDGYYPLYQEKELTLVLDLPENLLPCLYVDSDRLKQVLTILLDNALSYVPSPNSVTLSVHTESHALVLRVIDTGPGIDAEHKLHVFERFYQGDRSRHEKNHYGLGLSIAHEIISLHHGNLSLSDTPGGGCTFTITLPLTT